MMVCVFSAACERAEHAKHVASIVVTDDAGRTVQLDHRATRIVSLMPTVTDLVIAMGHAGNLIARTDYDTDARIANLPSIGGGLTPSVEWIAARKPDLVVSWPDNGSRSIVSRIDASGTAVYAARTETIADALRTVRNVGVLLGATAAADSLARALTSGLEATRRSVVALKRVRVAYVLAIDPPTIAGPGTFIDQLITIAGGENVFKDIKRSWPQISLEELVRLDPEVIVLARESASDPQQLLGNLPGWKSMRAVRMHHVYRVSPDYFNRSGPLMPRAARELADFFGQAR